MGGSGNAGSRGGPWPESRRGQTRSGPELVQNGVRASNDGGGN